VHRLLSKRFFSEVPSLLEDAPVVQQDWVEKVTLGEKYYRCEKNNLVSEI
jgi:hypothetical protein